MSALLAFKYTFLILDADALVYELRNEVALYRQSNYADNTRKSYRTHFFFL